MFEKVAKTIRDYKEDENLEIQPESTFAELGLDSLDTVELVMAFEEAFNAEIPDEDAEKLKTVGDAVRYIEQKLQK